MFTVIETPLFQRQWPLYWTEEERGGFAAYLADIQMLVMLFQARVAFGRFVGSALDRENLVVFESFTLPVLRQVRLYC